MKHIISKKKVFFVSSFFLFFLNFVFSGRRFPFKNQHGRDSKNRSSKGGYYIVRQDKEFKDKKSRRKKRDLEVLLKKYTEKGFSLWDSF